MFHGDMAGLASEHLNMGGQHTREFPHPIKPGPATEELDVALKLITMVKRPGGIAVNQRGEIIVTNIYEYQLMVLNSNGEKLRSIGSRGLGPGQFDCPWGVAVDAEGNILMTDFYNYRIQKFTAEGEFIAAMGSRGFGPLEFEHPGGIAVNPINGRVYVSDTSGIRILNSDLSLYGRFGQRGSGEGSLGSAQHIALDNVGNVYVADAGNYCICAFSAEGEFLKTIGKDFETYGLKEPVGIAIDSSNRVYVSEYRYNRVCVFTSEGHYLTTIGGLGRRPGQFEDPSGVAVDSQGVVYVCVGWTF